MMKNKFIVFFCICAALFFGVNIAYSSESHHSIVYVDVPAGTTITSTIGRSEGIASAIATAQHNFDYGTHSWQGSVGIGAFDTNTAFSFGLAKRFNKTLINGSVTQEEGKFGGGVGINWHF